MEDTNDVGLLSGEDYFRKEIVRSDMECFAGCLADDLCTMHRAIEMNGKVICFYYATSFTYDRQC